MLDRLILDVKCLKCDWPLPDDFIIVREAFGIECYTCGQKLVVGGVKPLPKERVDPRLAWYDGFIGEILDSFNPILDEPIKTIHGPRR